MISCYLGVTEPAMFGINLKYVYPFVAAMIGSGVAGMFANLMDVRANAIGVGGLPGILAIQAETWVPFIIAMIIAIIVPFGLTVVFRRKGILNKLDPVNPEEVSVLQTAEGVSIPTQNFEAAGTTAVATANEELFAVADGKIKAITEVNDPVFSQKMMGEGYAIVPDNQKIYSPVNGKVTSVFETKHAIGILSETGVEVLVHMGLDTVELKGAPFNVLVKEGDQVSPTTQLAEMDLSAVEQAGKQTDVLVVLTNTDKVADFSLSKSGQVQHEEMIGQASINR